MLKSAVYVITLILSMCAGIAAGQCPINIGFDNGDFVNWNGLTGNYPGNGVMNVLSEGIVPGTHTIISRASQQTDFYGQFPLVSPNGSNYITKLGNDALTKVGSYGKAQRLTFTFKVPDDDNEFSLIYYYALVIEDPVGVAGHDDSTKPRFSAAVFDVTANKYADCGNYNFVSISTLPGFLKAPNQGNIKLQDVFYKNWSPVTIDLRGYAGKTLRLEFTTTNCVPSGHFSYAYIDLNQNCTSPVSGNIICPNSTGITLSAPAGFKEYYWYNEKDFSTVISTSNTYSPVPTPPIGTGYSVRIVPYPGIGCPDTVYTTIKSYDNLALKVQDSIKACFSVPADITIPQITAGSDPSFVFTYYNDAACTDIIIDPTHITESKVYYIKATSPSGCFFVHLIKVTILETPLVIHNPAEVCKPTTVNITDPAITQGSLATAGLSYWTDINATMPLANPDKIDKSGTYYIKATNPDGGCFNIQPVTVLIDELPVLKTNTLLSCNTADIELPSVTAGSSGISKLEYYTDAQATIPLTNKNAIPAPGGLYYIKAYNTYGCDVIAPVTVHVSPYPQITVTNPPGVVFPATVDITQTFTHQTEVNYAYFKDSLCINVLKKPEAVAKGGVYWIQAVNAVTGCTETFPVKVTIYPPPDVDFSVNTFTPNGDGTNDVFRIKTPASIRVDHFRIYNSYGQVIFESTQANQGWNGAGPSGKRMPVGTYYWIFEGYDNYLNQSIKKSGSITLIL